MRFALPAVVRLPAVVAVPVAFVVRWLSAGDNSTFRAALLVRLLAGSWIALLISTWPLWAAQNVFPQVPLLRVGIEVPPLVEAALCGLLWLVPVALLLLPPGSLRERAVLLCGAALLLAVVVIDQHRLQPWAYQFTLLGLFVALARPQLALPLARGLTVSLYLYSALTKFDHAFAEELGPEFWRGLLAPSAVDPRSWTPETRWLASSLFPLGELLIGVLLLIPRTRSVGLAGSWVVHLLLLKILGPWGLGHQPAVLLWNVFFLMQNGLLFGGGGRAEPALSSSDMPAQDVPLKTWTRCEVAAASLALFAMFWPLTSSWGLCDAWLAWGLYASHNERTELRISAADAGRAPAQWQRYLQPVDADRTQFRLRLDRWSLDALGAPLLPQNRYQLGVVEGLRQKHPWNEGEVRAHSRARFWSGERSMRVLSTPAELDRALDAFWFNARPRANWGRRTW